MTTPDAVYYFEAKEYSLMDILHRFILVLAKQERHNKDAWQTLAEFEFGGRGQAEVRRVKQIYRINKRVRIASGSCLLARIEDILDLSRRKIPEELLCDNWPL